jgi:hypothetical protein
MERFPGRMKHLPALLLLLALALAGGPAWADAYAWGAESGRFRVEVVHLGFDDGAGAAGWEEKPARELAAWARRFNAVIPEGASVSIERGVDDDASLLTFQRGGRSDRIRMIGGPDFDAALSIAARHFGQPVPAPVPHVELYTLQLFASRSEARAARFASGAEARGVRAKGSFYHEACMPCSVPEVHVLGPDAGGISRVVTGIFDRYSEAHRALGELRRRFGGPAFVRRL